MIKKININNINLTAVLVFLTIALLLAQIAFDMFYKGYPSDEMEHLHVAWLVWSGKTPYIDFFEHHNPLLWYLFAPVAGLMYDSLNIVYVSRIIAVAASSICWFYIYKIITKWLGGWQIWLAAFLVFCLGYDDSRYITEFRPDTFMNLCFWSGLYYYLSYLEEKRGKDLIISFLLFTLSFFFLQKIILLLLVLAVYTFILLWKKQIKPADFTKALILPAVITAGFIAWLCCHGMLLKYIELNYTLNSMLVQYYGLHRIRLDLGNFLIYLPFTNGWGAVHFTPIATVFSCTAILGYANFLQIKKPAALCLVILFFSELGVRLLTFSPYPHYFSLLLAFASIITASVIFRNMSKFKQKIYNLFLFCFVCILGSQNYANFHNGIYNDQIKGALEDTKFIIEHTAADETVMNAHNYSPNLFRPDSNYVWFLLNDTGYVYETNFAEKKTDLDEVVLKQRPTIIFASDYKNTPFSERREKKLFEYNADMMYLYQKMNIKDYPLTELLINIPQPKAYIWNMELVKKYYNSTERPQLWILKDEYRHGEK
ncbi:MAG: glycosyltransferase family 39 protein [Alphaproteobacteria bacterium]|nr:glycosyltransferase family 39 protein [Alphaproteobacteria bacterium]